MHLFYYQAMVVLSLLLAAMYMLIWHKHYDVHIALMGALVPVVNLGFLFLAQARTLEEALTALKLTYIGGCYLLLTIMLVIFDQCDLPLKRSVRVELLTFSSVVFFTSLTVGRSEIFYKSVGFARENGVGMLVDKQYGPMHTLFQIMMLIYFALAVGAIVYSYFRRKQVSRRILVMLSIPMTLCILCYFLEKIFRFGVDLLPASYALGMAAYMVMSLRMRLYDISDSAIDSLAETGSTGFVSFDSRGCYLGSNETARKIFPELRELTVDRPIRENAWMRENVVPWVEAFRADEKNNSQHFERDGHSYQIDVSELSDGRRSRGYQLFVTDNTKDRQYIRLLNTYNTQLQQEVAEKTAHIVEMHDRLVLGMATMVESRDNSTGGHIRRTSEGVRILVEEMRRDGMPGLSEAFCEELIKAAPMHDLGKIAVDDEILRKPGRYTPEEYEKMKTHAAEGARIVRQILCDADNDEFRRVAENVAHYHHERWDGSGYPEGLAGEEIPLEARIMAIADVYDALVSKRVYKEKIPYDKANDIILAGMGTQFDKRLEPCYRRARPRLEAYYEKVDADEKTA